MFKYIHVYIYIYMYLYKYMCGYIQLHCTMEEQINYEMEINIVNAAHRSMEFDFVGSIYIVWRCFQTTEHTIENEAYHPIPHTMTVDAIS